MSLAYDWDAIAEFLIGECGKTLKEAMLTSYYEVICLSKGKERQMRDKWNLLRWGVFHIIWSIPGKKTSWPRSVERMFPMPWDKKKEIEIPVITQDEESAFFEIMTKYNEHKK